MTMITQEHAESGFAAWGTDMAHRAKAGFARWRRIRRNTVRLSDLDDRLLADIGVRREQIAEVARRGRLGGWG